ncbi:MAG: hypothetical protein AAGA37_09290 [Actinomycetota bacterium]
MSDFSAFNLEFFGEAARELAIKNATAAAAPRAPQQVFVQLGESRKNPNILRDNYAVPSFEIDDAVINDVVLGPVIRNKVVTQSIAPGTVVAKGTAIELVLAPAFELPGRIIPNGHQFFAEVSMQEAYNDFVRDDPIMRRVLERNPDPQRMSTEDRETVRERAANVTLSESAGNTVEDLVRSLHLARTMVE